MRKLFSVLLILVLTLMCVGCASTTATSSPTAGASTETAVVTATETAAAAATETTAQEGELTVYAAASLKESFGEMAEAFSAANGGAKVVFSFAGSNQLRAQIEEGAPADVFASANQKEMTTLVDKGLISGEPSIFAQNRLVVIVPKANPGNIQTLHDLSNDGLKLVTAGPNVPVGSYWLQSLDKLADDSEYGAAFKDAVTKNTVSQETDVKQVVAKVQLGEADAGIVYLTDVTAAIQPDVTAIEIPDAFNVIAKYPIGLIKDAKSSKLGQAFILFVLSPDGQAIMEKYNFQPGE